MTKYPRKSAKPLLADPEVPIRSRRRKPRDPDQARLPFDPIPERVEPCLALLAHKVPKGDNRTYEVKWDGYRLAIHVECHRVRMIARGGHDWTLRFPLIAEAARNLAGPMMLDGEAVVLDEHGRSDFGALQQALGGRGGQRSASEAIVYAFDLLYFDGHDLRTMAFAERRQLLEVALGSTSGAAIRVFETVDGDGDELFTAACEHDLEGIIAKKRAAPYTQIATAIG